MTTATTTPNSNGSAGPPKPPKLLFAGVRQSKVTLIAGVLVGLHSGTNYLFSAYGPQLSQRLGLSVTQTNVVSATGQLGMYLTGSIAGPLIDSRGPRVILIFSALILLVGWSSVLSFYNSGADGKLFKTLGLPGLAFAQFLTGVGSSTGNGSASNGVARSFTLKRRASALSVIFCSTGLSAFVYSTAFRLFFPATSPTRTSDFLTLLTIGSTLSMLLGSYLIRPALYPTGHPGPNVAKTLDAPIDDMDVEEEEEEEEGRLLGEGGEADERTPLVTKVNVPEELVGAPVTHVDLSGWKLVRTWDFWLLFGIEGLLSGIGLMYIANLGQIIHTLSPNPSPSFQTSLVALLSLFNASGRIVIGFLSDSTIKRFERVWWSILVSSLFLGGLWGAKRVQVVEGWAGLGPPTAVLGLAYGMLFGLLPVLCLDWFGLPHYSSNNGLLVLGPAIFGQLTNYLFGFVFDSHPLPCFGNQCYEGALTVTVWMAVGALGLSVAAGFRRKWRVKRGFVVKESAS